MNNDGYIRVAAVSPEVRLANPQGNIEFLQSLAKDERLAEADVVVLPELSVTGYSCGDLFESEVVLSDASAALTALCEIEELKGKLIAAGAPLRYRNSLYNCAVMIYGGKILCAIPKIHLPNNNEFYEKRWFASGAGIKDAEIMISGERYPFGTDLMINYKGVNIGVEICEDLWVPIPPSCGLTLGGADIILNLSATNEIIGKHAYLVDLIKQQSARCRCGYVYASAGTGESSTDLVYAGNAIIAEDGTMLKISKRFTERSLIETADIDVERLRHDRRNSSSFADNGNIYKNKYREIRVEGEIESREAIARHIARHPFVPSHKEQLDKHCEEIFSIQAAGLVQRLRATGCKHLTVGLSGGLDSTLAILVATRAYDVLGLDRKGIYAITMPGFGTTDRTYRNALTLIERLGVTGLEISIVDSVKQHFKDIDHNINIHDVTYENCQARERTQILMDYANKVNGMVLGTGDLSELALGWCTYNGDQMSMYGVNASVPKTLVKHLVSYVAQIEKDEMLRNCLLDIVDTPISPELIPAKSDGTIKQKTEDLVGPYELHDFFLYYILRFGFSPSKIRRMAIQAFENEYDVAIIDKWLEKFLWRFFSQQFKRSCMPDGPKVGSVCLSPRGDWRMPSDVSSAAWRANLSKFSDKK
ncbi:MAG: NAD(+) synthase [Muribaculaceae bacterium]|nr:NAD(+) synthase [Muribaculaceae bacterium]